MSEPLSARPRRNTPLTLAGVPPGFLPWLPPISRARRMARDKAAARWSIAADEAAMRALAETAPLFAPEVEVLTFPALGLPALRPRLAGAARDGRAAGDAQRAAGASATSRSCSSPPPTPPPSAR